MSVSAALVASAATCGLDLLWLGVLAKGFYRRELGHLMSDQVTWWAAALFYILYGAGVVYFCVQPALREGGLRAAALHGALLGLLVYGTYDLTNIAVLRQWGVAIALTDIAWGVFLTSVVSVLAYLKAR